MSNLTTHQIHPELEHLAATMPPMISSENVRSHSRMSISHAKGLLNKPGQNNCFLNSAVQVLWHLDIFRRSFRELHGHACMADSCIFCALKELFNEFQYSTESTLPPDSLRFALAEAFSDQRRFQLGYMDDAAECFENILFRIHYHITNKETESSSQCLPHCIPHQKFAMNLYEQIICHSCGATSEPFMFSQMVHYTSTSALCVQSKQLKNEDASFGSLLRKASSMGDIRNCPKLCGTRINIKKTLVNRPDIISIGLVWDSEHPTLSMIRNVFHLIQTSIRLNEVFDLKDEHCPTADTELNLVGLVTYYGKHYSTYLYHTNHSQWVYFDDATVRTVGPCWQQVVDKCVKGHFQPLLLLYSNPNGTVVSTQYALKENVPMTAIKKSSNDKSIHSKCLPHAKEVSKKLPPAPSHQSKCSTDYNNSANKYYSDVPDSPSATSTTSYFSDSTDGYISRRTVENIMKIQRNSSTTRKPSLQDPNETTFKNFNQKSNRNSSSSFEWFDSTSKPPPIPAKNSLICSLQRRDSGNSSGDRSSSVASVDPPYYRSLKSLNHKSNRQNSDQGYDSFSVSSSDSYPSNAASPSKLNSKLKQIPEMLENTKHFPTMVECDKLCSEADILLLRSHEKEREGDLRAAAALSDSAATKARLAMNIPYSNYQNLVSAKMKHSMCVMRSANLHKRVQEIEAEEKRMIKTTIDFHHSRQSSRDSTHGKHCRQSSKDGKDQKGSKENKPEQTKPANSPCQLEVYATLPRKVKKKHPFANSNDNLVDETSKTSKVCEVQEFLKNSLTRESSKLKKKVKELYKESDFSDYYSEWEGLKKKTVDTKQPTGNGWQSCRENESECYEEIGTMPKMAKKQCKVKRKLLLGNLLKIKNRSLPDLRENTLDEKDSKEECKTDNKTSRCSVASINTKGFHQLHRPFVNEQSKPTLIKVKPPLVGGTNKIANNKEQKLAKEPQVMKRFDPLEHEGKHTEPKQTNTMNPFLQELNQKRMEILKRSPCKPIDHETKSSVLSNNTQAEIAPKYKKPNPREIATFISKNATLERSPSVENSKSTLPKPIKEQVIYSSKPVDNKCSNIQVPIPIHMTSVTDFNSANYLRRNKPPDYETAIKRLSKQNVRFPSPPPISSNIYANIIGLQENVKAKLAINMSNTQACGNELIKKCINTMPAFNAVEPKLVNQIKKRASQKKSVKFSDQIEMVACADDPEEHLPNPLFEKVLGKNFLYTLQ